MYHQLFYKTNMKRQQILLTIDEMCEMVESRETNPERSEALMKQGLATGQLTVDKKSINHKVNVDFTTGEITYIPMEEIMKESQKVQEVTKVVDGRTSEEKRDAGDMAIDMTEKPEVRLRGTENVVEALEILNQAMTTQVITVESLCERILSSRGTYTPTQLKNQMFKAKSAMIQLAQISHWVTDIKDDGSEKRRPVRNSLVEFESVAYSKFWLPLSSNGMMSQDCDYLVCVDVPVNSYTNAKYGWNYAIMRVSSEFTKFNGQKVSLPTRTGTEGTKYEGQSFLDFDKFSAGHVDSWFKGFAYLEEAKSEMERIAKALSVLYRHATESERLEESADQREARLSDEQDKELAKAGVPALPDF